ncbi:MAG: PaaI family thioesterase [Anaerotignum sp.]|nr:PaaI family thioesterase [Anaerotignum sp.]
MKFITLTDDINSQENMEQWLSQLGHPDNPISNNGVLEHLVPHFVSCDFANREATIGFEALEWELNPGGSLHGGIIMTCFDVSFGLTCHYFAKQHMVTTVNLTTTFLKPVLLGDMVHYHVKVTNLGRTLISLTAEATTMRNGKEILVGTATATFMKLAKTFERPI